MKNSGILLIDDEPANLSVLSEMLGRRGWEVMAVRSGEAGVALAASALPCLILLDIKMPDMDGFEVCRRLKIQSMTRDIPVIFTTILADLDNKVHGFQAGAVDYIAKPFEEIEVLARVERHLELSHLRRELADKNAELEAFSHTVAHSLKNPLARMETLVALLLQANPRGADFARQAERILPLIQNAARQGRASTEALLKLAEVSQNELQHTLSLVDTRAAAERAAWGLNDLAVAAGTRLQWQDSPWPKAIGYVPWIEEMWCNYLDNALKYGGRLIQLGARQDGMYAEYWVEDNGPGITEEEQALLFQPFARLRQNQAEGHGLGLSIVKRIASRLGGHAGMSSAPGRTRFYFRLASAG